MEALKVVRENVKEALAVITDILLCGDYVRTQEYDLLSLGQALKRAEGLCSGITAPPARSQAPAIEQKPEKRPQPEPKKPKAAQPKPVKILEPRDCAYCGKAFRPPHALKKYCSEQCAKDAQATAAAKKYAEKHAGKP